MSENVREWGELSYEEKERVARILCENGYTDAHDVIIEQNESPESMSNFVSFMYLAFGDGDEEDLKKVISEVHETYDVYFNDAENTNNKGWEESYNYCLDYIKSNNGTNNSYFADYKGGLVSIVCNETGEEVYYEEIR